MMNTADVDDVRTWPDELRLLFHRGAGPAAELPAGSFRVAAYGGRVTWFDPHARRLWEHVLGVAKPLA